MIDRSWGFPPWGRNVDPGNNIQKQNRYRRTKEQPNEHQFDDQRMNQIDVRGVYSGRVDHWVDHKRPCQGLRDV
jgi:hypothetical protein